MRLASYLPAALAARKASVHDTLTRARLRAMPVVVPAVVVAEAGRRGRGLVITGDLQDLRVLARGLGNVRVMTV